MEALIKTLDLAAFDMEMKKQEKKLSSTKNSRVIDINNFELDVIQEATHDDVEESRNLDAS